MQLVTDGEYYAIRRSKFRGFEYKNLHGEGWVSDSSMKALKLCWGSESDARKKADEIRQTFEITVVENL